MSERTKTGKGASVGIVDVVRSVIGQGDGFIPLHEPEFLGNERKYVLDCIDTGWVSSVGAYVDRFEVDLARYCEVPFAVATMNGTAALHVAFLLAGVQPGDEVLMPSLTFIATANAASYAGAVAHFVDVERTTLGIDPGALDAHLQSVSDIVSGQCVNRATGRVIRAVCVMHCFGHPARMDRLVEVAARWHIQVVEDAAEALGSVANGRHVGSHGIVSVVSFNGNKVMTTGGGGAILTSDPDIAKRAKHLTTTARVAHRWNFIHDEVGFNYRLPNLNAALGCAQLEQMDGFIARKRALAAQYARAFAPVNAVSFLAEPEGSQSNYWLNAIILNQPDATELERVLTALNDAGIGARPVWKLMHQLNIYAHCPRAALPITEQVAVGLINLPSSPKLAQIAA
jgi:perosamine synthetase